MGQYRVGGVAASYDPIDLIDLTDLADLADLANLADLIDRRLVSLLPPSLPLSLPYSSLS